MHLISPDEFKYVESVISACCERRGVSIEDFRSRHKSPIIGLARQDAAAILHNTIKWDGEMFLHGVPSPMRPISLEYLGLLMRATFENRTLRFNHVSVRNWLMLAKAAGCVETLAKYISQNEQELCACNADSDTE